jgi:hypothetical protein
MIELYYWPAMRGDDTKRPEHQLQTGTPNIDEEHRISWSDPARLSRSPCRAGCAFHRIDARRESRPVPQVRAA